MTPHIRHPARRLLLGALCILLLPAAALAQDAREEGRRPAEEARGQAASSAAADESARLPAPAGEPSYSDVLASPDDVDLSYRYAVVQIRKGELRGASASLERILMIQPQQANARLLRALVLYRLDNLDDARRELDTLKTLRLPPDLRSTANAYSREIDRRSKRTHFGGRVGLGFEHDTNRNSAPAEGKALFLDTPLQLTGDSLRRSDQSLVGLAGLDARHQLTGPSGHEVFGGYNYYRQDQRDVPTVDLSAHSINGGALLKAFGSRWSPMAGMDYVTLSRDTFLVNRFLGMNVLRKLSTRLEGMVDFQYTYNDYRRTALAGALDERSGPEWTLNLGGTYEVRPTLSVFGSFGGLEKRAAKEYNAYTRYTATISPTWLLGRGFFLNTALQASFDRYAKADTAISAKNRSDNLYRLRGTLGAPLASRGTLGALVGTVSYEWYHSDSNIPNYSYDNTKLMMMMTYRWETSR